MKDNIRNKNLFDYNNFAFKDLLEEKNYPWEVIDLMDYYVDSILNDKKSKIGKGSKLDDSVKIDGKVIVGKNTTISDSVLIRGNCIIGDNVHIGHGVEIKHSIIMNNTAVAHLNYIGDSIIGQNVNIGGGMITANWRFDKKNIVIKNKDKRIDTGLKKFGAAVGDNSSLGVNAVLNPGVILGKNCVVFPLTSVLGCYESESKIK